jgi:hypothetical protein
VNAPEKMHRDARQSCVVDLGELWRLWGRAGENRRRKPELQTLMPGHAKSALPKGQGADFGQVWALVPRVRR